LARLRQRYALFFNLPEGVAPGQERNIEVDLAPAARRRYPDAEVRYRRAYMSPEGGSRSTPTMVTHAPTDRGYSTSPADTAPGDPPPARRRRVAVNEDGSPISPSVDQAPSPSPQPSPPPSGWPKADPSKQQ
jgi:hypothetical protein